MPGAENDVAVLVRMKVARERAATAVQRSRGYADGSDSRSPVRLQAAARSRWPACIAMIRTLATSYQLRSDELGIAVEVEELIRLRVWLPDVVVHFTRTDRDSGTRLLFRMNREGRTFCRIQQTRGRRQANLNRDDRSIDVSERNIRPLFRAIVQILIVH